MRFVKPQVFLIGKTQVINEGVAQWLKAVGCDDQTVKKYTDPYVKTNAERLIELAGRRCYMAFQPGLNPNVTKIREEIRDYLTNIMKQGHGSVIEHPTFTFAIEGVSRVFTGEMNRHRAGVAISEGSMRYIRYNDIPIVDVPSIQYTDNLIPTEGIPLAEKKSWTRKHIEQLVLTIEKAYDELASKWTDVLNGPEFTGKKHITSMMRRIIPMGIATGGVWTFNVRALRHMLTMRCSEAAEEEICMVAGLMLEIMMKEEPILFGDFKLEGGYWKPQYVKV